MDQYKMVFTAVSAIAWGCLQIDKEFALTNETADFCYLRGSK
jgi:hypothetical protein